MFPSNFSAVSLEETCYLALFMFIARTILLQPGRSCLASVLCLLLCCYQLFRVDNNLLLVDFQEILRVPFRILSGNKLAIVDFEMMQSNNVVISPRGGTRPG